jgi:hypothetical protein
MQVFMETNATTFLNGRGDAVELVFERGLKETFFPFLSTMDFVKPSYPSHKPALN